MIGKKNYQGNKTENAAMVHSLFHEAACTKLGSSISGLSKKTIRLFNIIIIFFPLTIAVIFSLVYMFGGWGNIIENHTLDFYFLQKVEFSFISIITLLLWIAIICACTYAILKISGRIENKRLSCFFIFTSIFVIAFGIRFFLLIYFSERVFPFSDFRNVLELAKGNLEEGYFNYYCLFPSYLNFSIYERTVLNTFGNEYVNILYINAVYSGLTASLVFLICREINDNKWIGILAGIIYAMYPSNIVFITTGTPDFLSVFFNSLGLYMFIRAYRTKNIKFSILFYLIGGVSLGIGSSFKTFSLVILIAFAIVMIARFVIIEKKSKFLISLSAIMLIVFFAYKAPVELIMRNTEEIYGVKLSSETAVPHYLLIGLNTESEGQIHLGTLSRSYYSKYLSNGMDYKAAKSYANDLLIENLKNNKDNILPDLLKKMIWAWQDDSIPVSCFTTSLDSTYKYSQHYELFMFVLDDYWSLVHFAYFLIMFFALIGCIAFARNKKINLKYEFVALVIFGYFCMILISEAQSRYKCLVMPYIVIVSALGINKIYNFYTKHKKMIYKQSRG